MSAQKKRKTPLWEPNINYDGLTDELFLNNHIPSWNYCDVGSCQGRFTNLFIELSKPDGKVYAFEINNKNPVIDGTIFERIAISDKTGFENFYEATDESSNSHTSNILGHDVDYNESILKYKIPSITLDEYFKDKPLNCIKIDVEGAELKAIKGGIETFKKCNLIVIECHIDEDWDEIYTLLTDNGFNFKNVATDEPIVKDKRSYLIYCLK